PTRPTLPSPEDNPQRVFSDALQHIPQATSLIYFFNHTATPAIYTLSLHDALPILLRMLAGFVRPDAGDIYFGEERITDLPPRLRDRKSTRLNSSHVAISYAVFCLTKKTTGGIGPSSCC